MLRSQTRKPLPPAVRAAQERKLEILRAEKEALLASLGGADPDKIVKRHIELLHTYNEIKDGTQALIGRYAVMTGTTVRQIHEELGLSLTE